MSRRTTRSPSSSMPPAGRPQLVEVDRAAEAPAVPLEGEQLLGRDLPGDALDPLLQLDAVLVLRLPDLALEVEEERAQVERVVEVVGQQLEVQHLGVEVAAGRAQVLRDDRDQHVLAQARLGLLAPAHQLGVEARVGVQRLAPFEDLRALHADEGDGGRGQQPADRVQQDRDLVPEVLLPGWLRHAVTLPERLLAAGGELAVLHLEHEVDLGRVVVRDDRDVGRLALEGHGQRALARLFQDDVVACRSCRWRRQGRTSTRTSPRPSCLPRRGFRRRRSCRRPRRRRPAWWRRARPSAGR